MTFDNILSQYINPILLKKGGQKSVYRVEHPYYGTVALKVGIYKSYRDLERIRREVETLRGIDSEYYPKNYDFQVLPENQFMIIEEYIDSRPLSKCVHEYADIKQAITLIYELTVGLNILWSRNIVHRDVKPDNILVTHDERIKIIDLGIARLLDSESLTTHRGAPLTRYYAAPEQFHPNPTIPIDFRTDQFNIGIILAQLLLGGEHPFCPSIVGSGDSIPDNIMFDNWYQSFLQMNHLSIVESLVMKLLGNQQYERYRTPDGLLKDIKQCLERL